MRRNLCGRDPDAGPGTCAKWFESCPAAVPDCFSRHMRQWAKDRDLLDPTVDPALVQEEYTRAVAAWRASRREQLELLP